MKSTQPQPNLGVTAMNEMRDAVEKSVKDAIKYNVACSDLGCEFIDEAATAVMAVIRNALRMWLDGEIAAYSPHIEDSSEEIRIAAFAKVNTLKDVRAQVVAMLGEGA